MLIRHATMQDLDALSAMEHECFPAAEAASRQEFAERIAAYGDHFWLLFDDDGTLVSFVNGMVTDEPDLTDDMYADASKHNEHGAWQMIFGVNTIPSCRRRGYASKLLRQVIEDARTQERKGVVLTCKAEKIAWYAGLGFVDEGLSKSTHGNVDWYQMRVSF